MAIFLNEWHMYLYYDYHYYLNQLSLIYYNKWFFNFLADFLKYLIITIYKLILILMVSNHILNHQHNLLLQANFQKFAVQKYNLVCLHISKFCYNANTIKILLANRSLNLLEHIKFSFLIFSNFFLICFQREGLTKANIL